MQRFLLAVMASTAISSAAVADDYIWSGVYGGVSGGVSGSNSNAKADYLNGADGGWRNSMFVRPEQGLTGAVSDFYDTLRDPDWVGGDWQHNGTYLSSATGSLTGYYNDDDYSASSADTNPLTPWLSILENDNLNGAGSVRLGANYQVGMFVLGAEADGSLLLNELVVNRDISESASLSTTSSGAYDVVAETEDDDRYGFNCNFTADPAGCSYSTEYDAHYSQDGEFRYKSSVDGLLTFRGRAGFAAGRAMFFATGGLAVGQIRMSTSAHTSEQSDSTWSGTVSHGSDGENLPSPNETTVTDVGSSTTSTNTSWNASDSKTAYGYAVGGGVSFAVTDNLIWTSDGYYYDLGQHSITATDNYDDSSYTVSQRFDGYVVRTGMEWKF